MAEPARGEIWYVDLDPTRGHEQAGQRPALIVSVDHFNQSRADLVVVLPLTRTARPNNPLRIEVRPPEGGVRAVSYIKIEDIRSVSKDRLVRGPWGKVSQQTMQLVADRLRILLDL